jgi:hypothetical protein
MLHIYSSKGSHHNSFVNPNLHLSTTNLDEFNSRIQTIEKTVHLYRDINLKNESRNQSEFETPPFNSTPLYARDQLFSKISPSDPQEKVL